MFTAWSRRRALRNAAAVIDRFEREKTGGCSDPDCIHMAAVVDFASQEHGSVAPGALAPAR